MLVLLKLLLMEFIICTGPASYFVLLQSLCNCVEYGILNMTDMRW